MPADTGTEWTLSGTTVGAGTYVLLAEVVDDRVAGAVAGDADVSAVSVTSHAGGGSASGAAANVLWTEGVGESESDGVAGGTDLGAVGGTIFDESGGSVAAVADVDVALGSVGAG